GASRALAAAVYLSSYYLGSSVLGTAVGLAWDAGQWIGVVSSLSLLLIGVLAIALHLTRLPRIVNA
ncbi:MAG TPA: MFS transporter, partial [Denitromonas sp.]|nr:MFS transporter [Denitromonas sp.]